MSKQDKRQKKKAEKRAINARLGWCHGCGTPWTKLTYEHVPPKRVQALIPEAYLRFNDFGAIGKSKGQLPPCTVARGGLQVKSFGECCQQFTQMHYGQAFFDWSRIVYEMTKSLSQVDDRLNAVITIEPLAVIKQIAAIALAASEFNSNRHMRALREFVQDPTAMGVPAPILFYAYVNPLRSDYQLPQCRLVRRMSITKDLKTGTHSAVFAEVSVPPLGYAALYGDIGPVEPHVQELMCLNHFGDVQSGRMMSVALSIPIRTPFGPFPLRFMQDAEREPRRIPAS